MTQNSARVYPHPKSTTTSAALTTMRLPDWIRTKSFSGLHTTKQLLRSHGLSTVCEEARCPNIGTCFSKPTATFMILGSRCTRNCGFCSVDQASQELPGPLDTEEPRRVALAALAMGLKYVVITSVTRDDLSDGGAQHFARTVRAIRSCLPESGIEVLTPDFKGNGEALKTVLDSRPDVFNHNVETVPRLYPLVRPQAEFARSLKLLRYAREIAPLVRTKSGLMLGLGETDDEIVSVLKSLRTAGCDYLTIGQYLRPSAKNLPVVRYVPPDAFERYGDLALSLGFKAVASAPLVRSSMNAEKMFLR
ncbi:MAG TPA: lipoyl synthase [Thermodesulfovibrionales bacterium]|nr:lipoyl synthase [Thermodesulfovibrionales bacterium]